MKKSTITHSTITNSFLILILCFFLVSCNSQNTWITNAQTILECKKELGWTDKAYCVESNIQKITDTWIQNCTISNIDSNPWISKSMKEWTLSDPEISDIDWVLKECAYYKEVKEKEWSNVNSESSPIFSSFIWWMAWSFVWNYLSDKMLSKKEEEDNNTSWWTNHISNWYVGTNSLQKSSVSTDKNWNTSSKTSNIEKIDKQHKTDNWNIKEMKAKSTAKTNYTLWDSWKNWSKVQSVKTSRTSTSSRSSWGSSSTSSSLG